MQKRLEQNKAHLLAVIRSIESRPLDMTCTDRTKWVLDPFVKTTSCQSRQRPAAPQGPDLEGAGDPLERLAYPFPDMCPAQRRLKIRIVSDARGARAAAMEPMPHPHNRMLDLHVKLNVRVLDLR